MSKNALAIPFITLLFILVILLNIPFIRPIIAFAYLSFVPGLAILNTLKLNKLGLMDYFLLSAGLSLTAVMFVGLLLNQLYIFLGFSRPLSLVPLTVAISTLTLIFLLTDYKHSFSIMFYSWDEFMASIRSYMPLTALLTILPIISVIGAVYINTTIMSVLCLTIGILCVLSTASTKLIPSKCYPFLIFSISISILLLNLLISKYIIGDDSSVEYYVFMTTNVRGYWGALQGITDSWMPIAFNSMLSVTLLPNVYSVLVNIQNEILFKILYSFIFSLVPIVLYGIYERETNKSIGLLSTLFFVFSLRAFFGELTGVNRQIVGEFFLILSISLWLDKTLPINKKRILLIIFGAALAVSHYSLTIIYAIFVSIVVIISALKTEFDDTFDAFTILAIFSIAFLWYGFTYVNLLTPILETLRLTFIKLTVFQYDIGAGNVAAVTSLPETFTLATKINLITIVTVHILLAIGIFTTIFLPKRIGLSDKYKLLTIFATIMLAAALFFPMIALNLNFTRFYAISLLFLSPSLAMGVFTVQRMVQHVFRKSKENLRDKIIYLNTHGKTLILAALIVFAYFLSQSGYVNYITKGAISSPTFDYYRMKTSSDPRIQIQLLGSYINEYDAFSAFWLSKNADELSIIHTDLPSSMHVLVSCALIPPNRIKLLTNMTVPEKYSFIYLDSLNVVKGIIPTSTEIFNISEIEFSVNENNLLYSNGNSQVWIGT